MSMAELRKEIDFGLENLENIYLTVPHRGFDGI